MKSLCLLLHGAGKWVEDGDRQVAQVLRERDVDVQWANWETPDVYFHRFDAVLVRTCYGYHQKLPPFLAWLKQVERLGARLLNDGSLVAWNSDKRYLRTLQNAGVAIVPTHFIEAGETRQLAAVLAEHGWDEAVVKPVVSANADNTWRVNSTQAVREQERFASLCAGRGMMVQPFLPEVQSAGELSLVYIDGALSHCVRKLPKAGDFRVQPEHGGTLADATPPAAAVALAARCLASLPKKPLYARVDGVMTAAGFLLMELELIEPNLYLTDRTRPIQTYVDAVVRQL